MRYLFLTILVFLLCHWISAVAGEISPPAEKALSTIEWVTIPAGEFLMGSTPEQAKAAYADAKLRSSLLEKYTFDAEVPQHRVYLSEYQISRHEITNAQYRAFVEAANRPLASWAAR